MSKINVVCENCSDTFERERGEHNRNQKRGRLTFCSLSCSCAYLNKHKILNPDGVNYYSNFGGKCGKPKDEYSPFRWFLRCAKRRKKEVNITLEYLKKLWEKQKGICPYTGWNLVLPNKSSADGWIDRNNKSQRASLDRIDCSKGYIEGNVQYVSFMANIAKGDMPDNEMFKFCKAVEGHRS